MMTKTRGLWITLAFLLLLLPSAMAAWQTIPDQRWLGVNNNVFIEGLNIRVLDVNVEDETARIRIVEGTNVLYQGEITTTDGYTRADFIKITAGEFRYKDPINPEVKLNVNAWRTVEVSNMNFPEEVYSKDAYKVFIVIKNPETTTAEYNVELSSSGNAHIENSNLDQSVNYKSTVKKAIPSASQKVTVPAKGKSKVYFTIQAAPRSDPQADLEPVFRIYTASEELLREVKLDPLPQTTQKVGYIEDIIVASPLNAGEERELTIKYRYSWMAASNDFRVRLMAPEFQVRGSDIRQVRAFPGRTQTESFGVIPFGGGTFTVTAEARIGQEVVDTLSTEISVVGEKIYKIISVEAPDELEPGDSDLLFVTVKNNGYATNTLSLSLESDDFIINNPEAVMKLTPNSDTRVLYNIKADTDKIIGAINVNLYDLPDKFVTSQYNKNDKLVDSQVVTISMLQEMEETTSPEQDTTEDTGSVDTGTNTGTDTGTTDQEPDDTITEPLPDNEVEVVNETIELRDWIPYIAIGALIIIAVALIIIGEKKRKKPDLEVYDIKK